MKRSVPKVRPVSDETLEAFILLGRQLAAQMAEETFRLVTAADGWTRQHIEASAQIEIERLELASRDTLASLGGNPGGVEWQAIWTAIEAGYRETIAALLGDIGQQGGGALH